MIEVNSTYVHKETDKVFIVATSGLYQITGYFLTGDEKTAQGAETRGWHPSYFVKLFRLPSIEEVVRVMDR